MVATEFPPGPGGIGNHAYCLAKELTSFSLVTVLCNGDYIGELDILSFDTDQVFEIERYKRFGIFTPIHRIVRLAKKIQNIKPDFIIYTGLFSIWLVNIGKLFANSKTRHVSIIHGHEPIFGGIFKRKVTSYSCQKFDIQIPVSRFSSSNLANILNDTLKRKNIHVIPNGIDLTDLAYWKSQSKLNKEKLEPMLKGYPKLLTVGHTSPRKGQHNVINALPEILKIYPDCFYYIIGRDVNNVGLMKLAEEIGVRERVIFIPPVKNHFDLSYYYENADIFMLLSENQDNGDVEGFGIVALEANYFGCPVIGAKDCGVEDAVSVGKSGFIVSPRDKFEVSNAVNITFESIESMKSSTIRHAESFDWKILGKEYKKLLCVE